MSRPRPTTLPRRSFVLLTLALGVGACETVELAPGDVNDIYVAADRDLWEQVGDPLSDALQPTVLTVIDELTFQVIHQDPTASEWSRVRTFKQVLLIGTRDDPWVARAVEKSPRQNLQPPAIFSVRDVWSRNQLVTVLLLSSDDPTQVEARLEDLHRYYDDLFREWALSRMFVSGRDSALADTLAREAGFTLLLPAVYKWDVRDSTYVFRNDNPSPDELIRQVTVTWRSPVPAPVDPVFTRSAVLEWRQQVTDATLTPPQVVDTSLVREGPLEYRNNSAFEVQAVWKNPPSADWPAAGPFITRVVACREQDRLYLLDAWLYAPGRDKYEYMIQLNTILDSFRCGR